MNEPNRHDRIHQRELTEPDELHTAVPLPFALIAIAFIAWGAYYFYADVGALMDAGDRRTAIAAVAADTVDGAALYVTQCSACHQATGAGLPGLFPPLAGSEWVSGAEPAIIQILLHGMNGSISVAGVNYQGTMPSFDQLADEEIAAVASHVRASWGNSVTPITAAIVQRHRAASADRNAPWRGGQSLLEWLDERDTD